MKSFHNFTRKELYEPAFEHESCGVCFVVNVQETATHQIVKQGITVLKNLEHRDAVGGDSKTGDGAGMLTETPCCSLPFFSSLLGFNSSFMEYLQRS